MSTKHIFNSAEGLVLKALKGAVALNPILNLHSTSKSIYVDHNKHQPSNAGRQYSSPTVAVISGGGAGHEPAHAGYTGHGMLSASVSGDIFASPSAKQILQTIYLASTGGAAISDMTTDAKQETYRDVLVIINNYTGDRLNFGLAIEKALASSHFKVESVVVADDVSLLQPTSNSDATARRSLVGARGLGGNILVCKILGALAERGETLSQIKRLGDAVVHNLASVGVGLEHCHVPGRGPEASEVMKIKENECEIGLGLHNESGVTRKALDGPEKLVEEMLDLIMHSKGGTETPFLRVQATHEKSHAAADEVVVFLNNLGGISQLEMSAALDEVLSQLAVIGVYPARVYLSAYMTSLNAPGFSISILNLSAVYRELRSTSSWNASVTLVDLLDDSTDALAWIGVRSNWPAIPQRHNYSTSLSESTRPSPVLHQKSSSTLDNLSQNAERSIRSACESVLRHQDDLTAFDTVLGDGDCGDTFATGARAILTCLNDKDIEVNRMTPYELVRWIGDTLEDQMGGTIGALFAIFFTAVSTSLRGSEHNLTPLLWGQALEVGLNSLSKHTPAKPGDRTLIDALAPFCAALCSGQSLAQAVEASRQGAESTKLMQAVLGRAAYVTVVRNGGELPPDPGAWGVLAIVEGLCDGL